MLHFEWIWAFAFLPLPLLFRYFTKAVKKTEQAALKVPFLEDFRLAEQSSKVLFSKRLLLYLAVLAWILLVLATTRPQWIGEIVQTPVSGRDLMLALDVSGSMEEKDFSVAGKVVNRLQVAKAVASDFIEKRKGDRIGLVVFGKKPYLQMPLSFDLEAVQEMLDSTFIGLAEKDKTAIGDAIILAMKRVLQYERSNRVLILLTDGESNAGQMPEHVAELAAQEGIKIYTIGIGSERRDLFGRVISGLDEKTLKMIANKTGGRYFRARNTKELMNIYAELNQLEPIERDTELFRIQKALYPYPLTLALLIATFILLVQSRIFRGFSRHV